MARGPGPPIGLGDGPQCPDTTLLPSPPLMCRSVQRRAVLAVSWIAAGNGLSRFPWPFRCSPLYCLFSVCATEAWGMNTVVVAHVREQESARATTNLCGRA